MKKAAFIIMTIILVSVNLFAFADVDLKNMSIGELIELKKQIEDEISTRINITGDVICTGDYLVGRDIKAGTYLITCTKKREFATYDMTMGIFDDEEKYLSYKDSNIFDGFQENVKQFFGISIGSSAVVRLNEGEHFIVKTGDGTCVSYNPSWEPQLVE